MIAFTVDGESELARQCSHSILTYMCSWERSPMVEDSVDTWDNDGEIQRYVEDIYYCKGRNNVVRSASADENMAFSPETMSTSRDIGFIDQLKADGTRMKIDMKVGHRHG